MMDLDLANGPTCPRCGCTDTEVRRAPSQQRSWYGSGLARCRHCGQGFHFGHQASGPPLTTQAPPLESQQPPSDSSREQNGNGPVYFRPVKCPECGSKETKVYKKMPTKPDTPTVRYHKCKNCGASFKSVEVVTTQ
jgi:DNA-directed RNA polymerase subunit M/transcription elongation factor TFIIS